MPARRTTRRKASIADVGHGLQPCRGYGRTPHRHIRLELSDGRGHLERCVLPAKKGRASSVPGFDELSYLRRALQHGRGELELLRHAAARGEPRLGRTHAGRLRVLAQALSEVHAPGDVQGEPARRPAGDAGGARCARAREPRRHRSVQGRHRAAGVRRQARCAARAVPSELQDTPRHRARISSGC